MKQDRRKSPREEKGQASLNKELSNTPTIAPGMDDDEELNQAATPEEVKKGDFTEVTTLSYDEVDPS